MSIQIVVLSLSCLMVLSFLFRHIFSLVTASQLFGDVFCAKAFVWWVFCFGVLILYGVGMHELLR